MDGWRNSHERHLDRTSDIRDPQSGRVEFVSLENEINKYADAYGADRKEMYAVMMCESAASTTVIGKAGEVGLFQYMPNTFRLFSEEINKPLDILSPRDQIELTAWAFSRGINYKKHWTCYRNLYQVY
jgi:soluble lytic murein transglycosylase-like protein